MAQVLVAGAVQTHLELQVGDNADQVGVATAFAIAVDGALHLGAAVTHRLQCIGYAGLAVVVGVDAEDDMGELAAITDRRGGQAVAHDFIHGIADLPG